jgi:hypothetical protein
MKPRLFTKACFLTWLLAMAAGNARGEIIFQDFFASPAGSLTNDTPWIDVQGSGWQAGGAASQFYLDGSGHVYNAATSAGTFAGVPMIPIGPHGTMTASALVNLPTNSTEWIGIGFANSNFFLTSSGGGSGPWLQVLGTGTMVLYGGAGLSNAVPVANAFTNNDRPIRTFLTCDNFHSTASAGTITSDGMNFVFDLSESFRADERGHPGQRPVRLRLLHGGLEQFDSHAGTRLRTSGFPPGRRQ